MAEAQTCSRRSGGSSGPISWAMSIRMPSFSPTPGMRTSFTRPCRAIRRSAMAAGRMTSARSGRSLNSRMGHSRAASADIDQEGQLVFQIDRMGHGQVNQARLLLAADHVHIDLGALRNAVDQDIAVGGFAHGAGRHSAHARNAIVAYNAV